MQAFAGIYAAAITPRSKKGDLDFGAAFELLDHLSKGGVDGVAIFTAAGEYPAFSLEERTRLLYLAAKRSRIPIWAGIGTASLDDSIRLGREARHAGAQALLLPPPLLFSYSHEVLRVFYTEFAAHMDGGADVFVCNVPCCTAPLLLETALCLMRNGKFGGFSDASGDPEQVHRLEDARADRHFELVVDDDRLLGEFAGAGALSTCACAVPELAASVHRGTDPVARQAFLEFVDRVEVLPPVVGVKVATHLRGIQTGPCAVPLPPAMQKQLDGFREWFRNWLPAVKRLSLHA